MAQNYLCLFIAILCAIISSVFRAQINLLKLQIIEIVMENQTFIYVYIIIYGIVHENLF